MLRNFKNSVRYWATHHTPHPPTHPPTYTTHATHNQNSQMGQRQLKYNKMAFSCNGMTSYVGRDQRLLRRGDRSPFIVPFRPSAVVSLQEPCELRHGKNKKKNNGNENENIYDMCIYKWSMLKLVMLHICRMANATIIYTTVGKTIKLVRKTNKNTHKQKKERKIKNKVGWKIR